MKLRLLRSDSADQVGGPTEASELNPTEEQRSPATKNSDSRSNSQPERGANQAGLDTVLIFVDLIGWSTQQVEHPA